MAIDQEILDLLEGQELNVKNLAIELDRSPASLYKPLAGLVTEGLIKKREKESQGKMIAFYSIPSEEGIEGCSWQAHKGILVAGRTYQKKVLEAGFWPSLEQDILTLREREENRHIAVVGLVGLGKSNTAIFLARLLDPSFAVNDIIFTRERLLELVADQPEDKSFVLDDIGVMLSSRGWQEKERGLIFSWLEICRMHRINTIATSPSLAMIDVNYQRLLHYILQVELKCKGHIHIIVFKPTQAGLKPIFKPVGILTFDLPGDPFFSIFQEYQGVKQKDLALSARASLERLKLAKTGVQEYIQEREISRVTDDVVRSALHTVGLDGNLPKADKDTLRVVMYDTLQDKLRIRKRAKTIQVKQGKENLSKARLLASYRNKYQAYLDKGRSEQYSKTLAYRLTYERSRASNLKNLEGVVGSLMRKLKPSLVEGLTLGRLDDSYLVRDLRALRDLLGLFKSFDQQFYSKLFAFFQYDPKRAMEFIQQTRKMRSSYRYHGKFSPSKWRKSVLFALAEIERVERWNALHLQNNSLLSFLHKSG
ncbi:unnamed protein product, partial [marine sediment metagenome]